MILYVCKCLDWLNYSVKLWRNLEDLVIAGGQLCVVALMDMCFSKNILGKSKVMTVETYFLLKAAKQY